MSGTECPEVTVAISRSERELSALWRHAVQIGTSIGATPEMAEDVAQDAVVKLLAEPGGAVRNPRAWLRVVVKNELFRSWRRHPPDVGDEVLVEVTEDPWPDADTRIEVRQVLGELPTRERAALALAATGHSQLEIAEVLLCSVKMIEKLLHQGRRRSRLLRKTRT